MPLIHVEWHDKPQIIFLLKSYLYSWCNGCHLLCIGIQTALKAVVQCLEWCLENVVRGGNPFFPWFMACSLTAVKKGHLVLNSSTTHGSRCTGNTFNTSLMTSDPSQCKLSNWRKCLCQAMLQCQMHFVSASPIAAVIPVLNVFFQCIHSMMCHHRYHK